MKIYPVIHHIDDATTRSEVRLAKSLGADGVFLISHGGGDQLLLDLAWEIKQAHPSSAGFEIGINMLQTDPLEACAGAASCGLDMVWADNMGVSSKGLTLAGTRASKFSKELKLFAGVAFKYQVHEPDPQAAAKEARAAGFIPTTSGEGTGKAADPVKIQKMHDASGGVLAIASGITPENFMTYAPYLSHVLVSTGISVDEHHLDAEKLRNLVAQASRVRG